MRRKTAIGVMARSRVGELTCWVAPPTVSFSGSAASGS
jgi:hypothetical protein